MYYSYKTVTNIMSQIEPLVSHFAPAQLDQRWHMEQSTVPFNRLYLVEEGEAFLGTDSQHIVMQPGMAYLVPAGLSIWSRCDRSMRKLFIHFNVFLPNHYDLFFGTGKILTLPLDPGTTAMLRRQGDGNSIADGIAVKGMLYRLLAQFQEKYSLAQDPMPVYSTHISATLAYIQQHLSANLRVEELAAHSFVSKTFLTEHFRREVGVSIGRYIDDQLMIAAQWQLSQTKESIQEISRNLGFSDQCYFSRRFKQLCGLTPLQYRKESRA